MPRRPITHANIFRVLLAGFLLVFLLLVVAAFISVKSIRDINESVADLVGRELVAARLLDDIQHEQVALAAVFLKLSRDPEVVDREKVLSDLDEADDRMEEIGESVKGSPEEPVWNELKKAAEAFSAEARRLLSLEHPSTLLSRDLFRRHQEALSIVARLAAASHAAASNSRQQIDRHSRELLQHSALLLGACLVLAVVCSLLTLRLVFQLIRRMEHQAGELSRVSWHMLESQETTARRFSHELHDELGQSLTALKANLRALESQRELDRGRLEDCIGLVTDAIGNVREMSQLLHPTILDDFGLDAAVRWLSERFTQRTGIDVEYVSSFSGRLPIETETHLFRICQEALTNIARHSGAAHVRIDLRERGSVLHLGITDDGRGLPPAGGGEERGMGLIGMRGRARNSGGELVVHSSPGKGVNIEVEVPLRGAEREEKDPHLVGG